jgi:PAS domain S-box-containing protein
LLQIQFATSKVLASAEDLQAALPSVIASICLNLGWEMGAFWQHASNRPVLVCTHISAADKALGTFIAESRKNELLPGEGLPGRVFATSEPEWIANIHEDKDASRSLTAARAGLQSAFAFPVLVDTDAIAVLEFFSYTFRAPDQELLETMVGLGRQMGQFVKRKEAEEALHHSFELHRSLTDSARDAIITMDDSSSILLANLATEKLFGYPVSELKGQSLTMLMPEYMRHRHEQAMADYLKTGRKRIQWHSTELIGRHRDGQEMLLEISFGEFTLKGKRLFTGFIRDITERRRIEESVKSNERLAVIGRLAASIAHEINNPLDSIKNIFYLLGQTADPEQASHIRAGEQELRNITEIIRRTLDFTRAVPSSEPVDPGALLDDSVLLLAHRIRQMDVTVERHYRAVKPFPGAAGDLRQVFVNLIDNALDALTPPGKIWLRTHSHRCPGGAESLVVVIADSGRGIPSEIRKQLFQPLFTTKGEEGTGLGLWITREILQKHGARIHVRSRTAGRWQGTCFRIVIPLPHPPVA